MGASGSSLRIEASKKPHAESLQGALARYEPDVVRVGPSWQVEIPVTAETEPLLDLIKTLTGWLEQQRMASLQLHFDGRSYTLLRPADGHSPESAEALREEVAQLQTALESRVVIEQAKGVLCERYRINPEAAFKLLRASARSSRTELRALAQRVLDEPATPKEIAEPHYSTE
jgi:hypothetical protein